jgi:hypothetical protein
VVVDVQRKLTVSRGPIQTDRDFVDHDVFDLDAVDGAI